MRKRKNDEAFYGPLLPNLTQLGQHWRAALLVLGMAALAVVSVAGTERWLSSLDQVSAPPTLVQHPVNRAASTPRAATAPEPVALARDARFLVSAGQTGALSSNAEAGLFRPLGLSGFDVAVAPGRPDHFAYHREGQLYVHAGSRINRVDLPGKMPAWSADGKWLAFVVREMGGDAIYRLERDATRPIRLLTVAEIAAPPLPNPATGRLLIVERLAGHRTAFYTIDPTCATHRACLESRQDITIVDAEVNWADYHPSATAIGFSERSGGLYLLATASGEVEPLLPDGVYKRRPAFSPDGTRLAYLTEAGGLFVLDLRDGSLAVVPVQGVESADWAE